VNYDAGDPSGARRHPPTMTDAERRQQRIEDELCTRCGQPAMDGSEYCAPHDADAKARKRRSMAAKRKEWRRRKLCVTCGRKRRGTARHCAVCLTRLGRLKSPGVDSGVDKRDRIAAATVVDKDGRTRYLGRRKRGAPGVGSMDRGDLELAVHELMASLAGLELYESTAGTRAATGAARGSPAGVRRASVR
jgi:hypothetical protein